MTAPMLDQVIAAFALHALWQVPVLGIAAWSAIRIGRARVHVSHAVWVATLVLCVVAPVAATWQRYREARSRAESAAVNITFSTIDVVVPHMQREPAWKRMLTRHLSLTHGVTPIAWMLPSWLARTLAAAYAAVLLLACCRLLWSLAAGRRLVRSASSQVPQTILDAVAHHAGAMGCTAPRTAVSSSVSSPLLVGTFEPTLLLPAADVPKMTADELHAVLAHELMHVRRYDPLSNALCSWLLVPVRFHPAAGWIASRIRQTREMACDADAAAWMGSTLRYADALLRVAERAVQMDSLPPGIGLGLFDSARNPAVSVRDRLPRPSTRPAAAGLELLGAQGAMEERMNTMFSPTKSSRRSTRVARSLAAATIAVSGITTAWMMQVQPAFAAQEHQDSVQAKASAKTDTARGSLGGHAAQRQLQDADRRLDDAKGHASTDADRNKIAAAQQVIRMAQHELEAEAGQKQARVALDPEMMNSLSAQQLKLSMAKMQTRLDSPELQAQLQATIKNADAMRLKLDSPEFKEQLERTRKNAEAMQLRLQSPEFQARIRKQAEDARQMAEKINSAEFQARIAKQVADANTLMARNTLPPPIFGFPDSSDAPKKVSSEVMAGNIVTKVVPVYPQSAKDAKIDGEVVLHAIINEEGSVEQLSVSTSPDDALSKSAVEAVRQWKYKPYLLNGKPTAVETTITVHYSFAA